MVLCHKLAGRPAGPEVITMMDRYRELESAHEHAVFHALLGLSVLDLAAGAPEVPQIAGMLIRHALEAKDAYSAHDALSHPTCRAHTTPDDSQELAETVQAAALGRGTIPGNLLEDLRDSIGASQASMADALAAQLPGPGTQTA